MKILLTGATGYIGKRILPALVEQGHLVYCCVRDRRRFEPPPSLLGHIEILELDLLDKASLKSIPSDIDAAFYLIHSMSSSTNYQEMERLCAVNFREALSESDIKQVIYLSGIVNEEKLSDHLLSRKTVEEELRKGNFAFTCLRAGIIVGSGSASFEIMRDLVEKLPVMVTPKWLRTLCQPIGIADVIRFLTGSLFNDKTYNREFDIGGDEVLTYKEMLMTIARVRNLKRRIIIVPVMTPKLSSYWLYFVTSTSYKLATSLVDSMKVNVVCKNEDLKKILNIETISYEQAVRNAFDKIKSNEIISSWKDSYASSGMDLNISDFINVPSHGCLNDVRIAKFFDRELTISKIWSIGGKNGWYYGNWLWGIRGLIDKMVGGVGLRRGRTNPDTISAGDALDFWRVLYANRQEGRLLLLAEMKLPGEAWLEFRIKGDNLIQTATFRPRGVSGRLYWFAVYPFHGFIFNGMVKALTSSK